MNQKNTITKIESGVRSVISKNLRGLPNVEIGELNGFTDLTETMLYGGQVLDKIMPILETAKIGNRMRWDPDRRAHVFELYKGRDLTEGIHSVVFSEEYKTAKDLVIANDDSVFKNVIYVPGTLKDDDKTEIVVEVGTATGDERFEKWLDRSFRQDKEETETQFRERLKQIGLHIYSGFLHIYSFGKLMQDPNKSDSKKRKTSRLPSRSYNEYHFFFNYYIIN